MASAAVDIASPELRAALDDPDPSAVLQPLAERVRADTGTDFVVVNQAATVGWGRDLGTVVTLRDHTGLRALVTELHTVRGVADSLGAQAHEAANRPHTVLSLIELGRADQALEFATTQLTVDQYLTDAVLAAIAVAELAALVVGKAAQARDRGVDLELAAGTLGASRVTARRYLEYLVATGLVVREARYGTAGRPQTEYRRRPGGVAGT